MKYTLHYPKLTIIIDLMVILVFSCYPNIFKHNLQTHDTATTKHTCVVYLRFMCVYVARIDVRGVHFLRPP